MIRSRTGRRERGSVLALAAALGFALIVLGVGFFFFVMFMNAQKETKNAVDAGTLNVGKQALDELSVNLLPSNNQRCFWDVCKDEPDNSPVPVPPPTINLRRINRVWAEAMLFKINALAQKNQGQDDSGMSNASSALQGAEQISNQLSDKLKSETNLHGFFTSVARQNNIRMIGNQASVKEIAGPNWQTSRMEQGGESNIMLGGNKSNDFFAPQGFDWSAANVTETTRNPKPANSNGMFFLKGYENLQFGDDSIWQVPFLFEEKPHLVSKTNFESAKNNASGWSKPVPNAFSAEGVASQPGKPAEKAMSWMITNPRQTYKAAIPHSFIRIKIDKPKVNWWYTPLFFPVKYSSENYGFLPEGKSNTGIKGGPGCATVQPQNIMLGLDVVGLSPDGLIFSYPPTSETKYIERELVARCNEMITKVGETVTAGEVHSAMSNVLCAAALASGLTREFVLYSPDGKSLSCLPFIAPPPDALWLATLMSNKPDGSEKKRAEATSVSFIPFHFPQVTPLPFFVFKAAGGTSTYSKTIYWTPGTGFNGCLGDIRVFRETDVYSTGLCTPIF